MARWEDVGPDFETLTRGVPLSMAPLSNPGVNEARDLGAGVSMYFAVTRVHDDVAGEAMVVEAHSQAAAAVRDRGTGGAQMIQAYWAPQGGSIGIPVRPDRGRDPQVVFTPDLSGCSVVVEKMNEESLRVSHVQGGRHHEDFSRLGIDPRRVTAILSHEHYANGSSNDQAAAFLKFDRGSREWNIHWQARQGTINIQGTDVRVGAGPMTLRGSGSVSAVRRESGVIAALNRALESDRTEYHSAAIRMTRSQSSQPPTDLSPMEIAPSTGSRPPWQRGPAPNPRDTPFRQFLRRDNPDTERRR